MTPEQRRAVEEFRALRGVEPFGPFVLLLDSPELMSHVSALGEYLRFRSALSPRLRELAILVTAAHWRQRYEWDVHAPSALAAGVTQDTIDSLWAGNTPAGLAADEQVIHDIGTTLHRSYGLPAELRRRAVAALGEQGVTDAIGICGYYAMLAMVLNSR